jgi:hypothetical protein
MGRILEAEKDDVIFDGKGKGDMPILAFLHDRLASQIYPHRIGPLIQTFRSRIRLSASAIDRHNARPHMGCTQTFGLLSL